MFTYFSIFIVSSTFCWLPGSGTVFQGECADRDVLCEQLCLTISQETYECGCWNDHTLLDDGLSCRLNATRSTARDRPTELQTSPTMITTSLPDAHREPLQLLPVDKEPPLRFNGRSFVEFPLDDSFYLESNVTIEFKTNSQNSQQDSLLLFAGEFEGDDFFSLAFQGPNIILRFDCGEGPIEDIYRGPFKSDEWHLLTVHRRFCQYADMKADMSSRMVDETQQFKYYKGITVDRGVFIGGAPQNIDFLDGRAGTDHGLDGCVRRVEINDRTLFDSRTGTNLAVNREKLDYCTDSVKSKFDGKTMKSKISTTSQPSSPSNPEEKPSKQIKVKEFVMQTGGAEDSEESKPHVESLIRPAATKISPKKFIPKVKKSSIRSEKDVSIEKVSLKESFTQKEHNVSTSRWMRIVEFSGDSHVSLSVPEDIEDYLEIVLHFKPSKNQGILFAWSDAKRYLVLTLESGFVNVHASMGFDAITLRSESVLSLHTWHKAEVWRSGKGILLKVDKQSWIESELHSVRPVGERSKGGMATIGGSNAATPAHILPIHGFHGCMKRVVLNGHHMHLGSLPSLGIRECGSDPCATSGCPSGCASRHDSFICLCHWPTYGPKCSQKTENSIESMNFAGHSYLEFHADDYMQHVTGDQLRLVVEFRLANKSNHFDESQDQILVFAGSEEESSDFLKLVITKERKVKFEINLGSGMAELTHSTVIPFERWTTVQVFRERRTLRLSVDGEPPVTTVTPGTSEQLNVYKSLYIGGYESDVMHAEGLSGCIRMAEIGTRIIRQPSDASIAINIRDCPL